MSKARDLADSVAAGSVLADGVVSVSEITSASGANLNFADNSKAIFGAGSDLEIYHDGDNSIIREGGTGTLRFQANGPYAEIMNGGATETMARFNNNGSVDLYYDNALKLATTATGIDVTGNTTFADNGKAIFGAGSDLQIYHDGSASYIAETGTGPLNIQMESTSTAIGSGSALINFLAKTGASLHTAANLSIHQPATTEGVGDFRFSVGDGAGVLTETLRVNSTGIDVTGTVVSDGLTVEGASAGTFTAATFRNTTGAGGTRVQAVLQNSGTPCDINLVSERVGANAGADFIVETSDGTTGLDIQRLRISEIGDISFYEDTGTTPKFFWDASAESLGIGTTSPANALHVKGATTVAYIESTGINGDIQLKASGTTGYTALRANGDNLAFLTATAERLRITSAGLVGIGTSAPSTLLDLRTANGVSSTLRLGSSGSVGVNTTVGTIQFYDADSDDAGIKSSISNLITGNVGPGGAQGGNLLFSTALSGASPTERMRITSAGDLLVGTTTTAVWDASAGNANDNGISLLDSGVLGVSAYQATANSGFVSAINRTGTDGNFTIFRKNGATVGSIGTNSGKPFIVDSFGVGVSVNRYNGESSLMPAASSSAADAAGSLGAPSNRWKDLYLSGGVYVGGTAAANLLDDYEEGTWTPSWTNLTIGNGSESHIYTKVGNVVTLEGIITFGSTTSISGVPQASLPFTSNASKQAYGVTNYLDNGSSNHTGISKIIETNKLQFVALNTSTTYAQIANLSSTVPFTWTTDDNLRYSITYITS